MSGFNFITLFLPVKLYYIISHFQDNQRSWGGLGAPSWRPGTYFCHLLAFAYHLCHYGIQHALGTCLQNEGDYHPVLTGTHSASASTLTLARNLPPHKGKHSIFNSSARKKFFLLITDNPNLPAYITFINPTFYQVNVEGSNLLLCVKAFEILADDYNTLPTFLVRHHFQILLCSLLNLSF